MLITDPEADNYWVCIVGPVKRKHIPNGGDMFPRRAVADAVEKFAPDVDISSGWGYSVNQVGAMRDRNFDIRQLELRAELADEISKMTFMELVGWWRKNKTDRSEYVQP
jgi:hypothetical protein